MLLNKIIGGSTEMKYIMVKATTITHQEEALVDTVGGLETVKGLKKKEEEKFQNGW